MRKLMVVVLSAAFAAATLGMETAQAGETRKADSSKSTKKAEAKKSAKKPTRKAPARKKK
jgi:hypothetical protein